MILRKTLKVLHDVSAAGIIGSFATCLVLALDSPSSTLPAYVAAREDIVDITRWMMMPSMVVVLISGLLAMAATPSYLDAPWVWIKAALGLRVFEGTLVSVGSAAQRVAELSALVTAGRASALQLHEAVSAERNTLWLLLSLALINVVLANV